MADTTPRRRLVYGEVQDGLVFIDEGEAHDLVKLHKALGRAKTWGEFKAQAPSHWYEDAVERLEEQLLDEVEDYKDIYGEMAAEQRFDAEEIPGYADGDWPGFPHMSMEHLVPDEIQERFLRMGRTAISGDYLYLPPDKEDEFISAMRDHGYDCIRDDDLVWEASGY